jgi:hypothetical protein
MNNLDIELSKMMVKLLKDYKEAKEKEGFVPTIQLLVEDLEKRIEMSTF